MTASPLHLDRFALFNGLSVEDLVTLENKCIPIRHLAGVRIFDEGEPAKGFYLVQEGQVKIFKTSPRGQEQILAVIGKGNTFAEAAAFGGRGYPASAECLEDSELIFVGREPIRLLLSKDPDLALRMMASMALKLRKLVNMVEDLTLRDARGRLARYLVNLVPESAGPTYQVKLPTRKSVLAHLLGLSQETLSRTLSVLKEDGLACPAGGRVLSLDRVGLQAILGDEVTSGKG